MNLEHVFYNITEPQIMPHLIQFHQTLYVY
jgi:hypothetical protein